MTPSFSTIILLELLVVLVDIGGSSASKVGLDTQSSRAAGTNIRRLMVDLNMPLEDFESHERSMARDPAMHSYYPDFDGEEVEVEPVTVEVEDEEEPNYFTHEQLSLTQPAITERYDHPSHFTTLSLGVIRPDVSYGQGGPDDDPTSEFEIGQQFDNKEVVLIAIKIYSIRRAVEYKILESDQLKYSVKCTQFGSGCEWSI
ncbi:hypothetical protein PIB30_073850 [Stylosanthes scabra]|uniref:Transposase MuDR plant domain-containing protein n=1 Tax=Stylosanthes scabra TaxID=79078 RepID=A0ABU6XMT2_9FABA|nr:hypothetical protein [Stylosanthes scabra]